MSRSEAGRSTACGVRLMMWPKSSAASSSAALSKLSSPSRRGISMAALHDWLTSAPAVEIHFG